MEVPEHPREEGTRAGARAPVFTAEVTEEFSQSLSSMGSLAPLVTVRSFHKRNGSVFAESTVSAEPEAPMSLKYSRMAASLASIHTPPWGVPQDPVKCFPLGT